MRELFTSWFFAKEKAALNLSIRQAEMEAARAKRIADEAERWKASLNIVDLVRELMRGFNPRMLETEDELTQMMDDEDGLEAFLAEAKKLSDNTALPKILAYIERNQIVESAREAPTLDTINFGRATLNGVSLVREEVERLKVAFEERHAQEETFDAHEAL